MVGTIKVAHVARRFSPAKWGGTENMILHVAQALERRGVGGVVFCTSMFSRAGDGVVDGVRVRRFRYVLPWFGLSWSAREQLRLKGGSPLSLPLFFGLLREKELSLIHAHVQRRLGGMARTAARLRGIPYVVSLHGGCYAVPPDQHARMMDPFRGRPEWGKVFGWLFGSRRVLDDAAAIICVGQDEYEEVRRRHPGKVVHLVPNGVDVARFAAGDGAAFRAAFGLAPGEPLVLCVSRIDYQKNQLGLVRAFARFAERHPGHRLVLVGPVTVEAYRDELLEEVVRLGLDGRVRLVEGLEPGDPLLPGAYRAAQLFVLPSLHEPFGMVVLEAWAAGVPVVASRIGGLPGFVRDRENGLLAEAGDEAGLAARMGELADEPVLRASLASSAFAAVSTHYGWDRIADRIQAVYEKAIGNG